MNRLKSSISLLPRGCGVERNWAFGEIQTGLASTTWFDCCKACLDHARQAAATLSSLSMSKSWLWRLVAQRVKGTLIRNKHLFSSHALESGSGLRNTSLCGCTTWSVICQKLRTRTNAPLLRCLWCFLYWDTDRFSRNQGSWQYCRSLRCDFSSSTRPCSSHTAMWMNSCTSCWHMMFQDVSMWCMRQHHETVVLQKLDDILVRLLIHMSQACRNTAEDATQVEQGPLLRASLPWCCHGEDQAFTSCS